MDPSYVESVWWSLKRLHQRGLLVEADKLTPTADGAAPRSRTPRSPSATSRSKTRASTCGSRSSRRRTRTSSARRCSCGPPRRGRSPSNTGVAVDASATYVVAERDGDRVDRRRTARRGGPRRRVDGRRTLRGEGLLGARYEPPYPNVEGAHTVVAGAFVQMEDGTGIVHMAPAFGAEDLEVGLVQGWPVFKPVGDDGRFTDLAPEFIRGLFVKDADPVIVEDLSARGRLLRPALSCTRIRSAGDAGPRSSITRAPPGTSARRPSRNASWRSTSRSTGTPITSSTGGSATGWRTTSTGRSPRAVLGDAAADLAVSGRARDRDRLARRARHARRTGLDRPRSAPPHHR